ncbi:hypothetical protein H0H87_005870 [Tephrocybe sp. NHM501043]|nr:hypothetical protein H0H87_005870 [Tephrocybe sp. NHM501043]
MTESSVSRWNAIPEQLKRTRPYDDDDDDDDVSLVSRTPSPPPMDVDAEVHKYDEYVRGAPREVITVDTKIKPTNKGFAMLAKLGWVEGQPLGVAGDGRIDPIPFQIKRDLTGLGKSSQDVRMIETTVSQRRGLDSERQRKETEDQRRAREELVARKSALEDELSSTLKAFYCSLCDKQFKNVAQYDEHTNSYAHHHKARYKDMQANVRLKPKDEIDKRKEKERKREEKELRKIAAANGIKMAKPTVAAHQIISTPALSDPPDAAIDVEPPRPPTKGGWATVSSPAIQQTGPRTGRWASVGAPATPPQLTPTSSEATQPDVQSASNPVFKTAGWTSLDTGSSEPLLPPPPLANHPLPTATSSRGGWSNVPQSTSPVAGSRTTPHLSTVSSLSPIPITSPLAPTSPEPIQQARSGWQQFQKSGIKRR